MVTGSMRDGLKIIGLTGNIACGKSSVDAILEKLGAEISDADLITRDLQKPGRPVYNAIVERFGTEILSPDGTINRVKLGQIVFSDPKALQDIEALVHPKVLEETWRQIEACQAPAIILDAIKLIEVNMHKACHSLWVVICTPEQQVQRLMKQRGMSEERAWFLVRAQPPAEEKIRLADVVIDNSGTPEETRQQVEQHYREVLQDS